MLGASDATKLEATKPDAQKQNETLTEIRGTLWKARWYRDEWDIYNPTSPIIVNCTRDVIDLFQNKKSRIPLRLIGQKDGLVSRAIDVLNVKRFTTEVPDFLKAAANSLHDDVVALRDAGKEPVFIPDNSHYNDQFLFIGAKSEIPSVVEAREKHMPDFVERDPPDKRWKGHSRPRARDRAEWMTRKGSYEMTYHDEARKLGRSLLIMDNSHANKTIEVAEAGSPGRSTISQPSSNRQKPSNPGQNPSPTQQSGKLKRIPFKNTTGVSPSPAGTLSYTGRGKTASWSGLEDKGLGGQVHTSARFASADPFDEDDEVEDQFPTPTRLESPSTGQNQLQTPAAPTRKHAFDPVAEDDPYASSLSGVHSDKESSVVDLTGIDDMASSPLTKRAEPSGALSKQPQKRARGESLSDEENSEVKRRLVASLSKSTDVSTLGRVVADLGDALERKHQLGLAMDQASQCLKDAAQCEKSEEEEERVAVFRVQLLEKTLRGMEAQHTETSAADGLKALAAGDPQELPHEERATGMKESNEKDVDAEGPKDNALEGRQPAPKVPQSDPDTSVNKDTAVIRSEIRTLQASIPQIHCRRKIDTMVTTFWTNEENKAKDELKQVEDTIHKLQSQLQSLQEQLGNILPRRRQG